MKSFVSVLIVLCAVAAAGTIFYLHRQKDLTPAAPIPESAPADKVAAPKLESKSPQTISAKENKPVPNPISAATASETNSEDATNSIHKIVDALLTAKSGAEKHDLFQQLLKSGQMDAAIAELKHRAADNPNDAEIPTTIGEALLNKVRTLYEADAAGNNDEIGIMAMQADQSFKAALKIDPQNWEAQFVKNSSMYYWPANSQVDNQVVQNLSSLIDQQDAMTAQPQFAQTYVVLGNEYLKIGQPEKAAATWQLGAQKFPNDSTLQQKISGR